MNKAATYDIQPRILWAAQGLMLAALFLALTLHLLPALLSGLLIYQLAYHGATALGRIGVLPRLARFLLLVVITGVIIAGFAFGIAALMPYMRGESESLVKLLQRMADVVDTARNRMPAWAQEYLPGSLNEWQAALSDWLRNNAMHLSLIGRNVGMFLLHVIIGMVIGGLVVVNQESGPRRSGPLAEALKGRAAFLSTAFRRVVFSQIRISALNSFLTAIFLLIVMPMAGSPLPFAKTLIGVTFLVGLLPIVGNLISNTVIFLIALSVSPSAAISSLIFLIVIHKLEYFVNARIIGTQIRARAWEILIAMLTMEAAFGIPGIIAAPIYYAYVKEELSARGLI